jgi:hypothetical protein
MDPIDEMKSESKAMEQDEFERRMELEDDPKRKKFIALYQARTILSQIGRQDEKRIARKYLKIMKRDGIKSV